MPDPRVISLDLESHGSCSHSFDGRPLPPQTTFHPARMLATDGCLRGDLALTCAITIPHTDPRPPTNSQWDAAKIGSLRPNHTIIFNLWDPTHVSTLRLWLLHADTLIGMNIKFDLKVLRAFSPYLRSALAPRRHTLIDLSVLNYLHNETRPEQSLKDIGPLFLLYRYSKTLKDGYRFPSPTSPDYLSYQAQDPHNTLTAVACLARHIQFEFPSSPKLSGWCTSFYSRVLWSCLLMEESGIAFSVPHLRKFHDTLTTEVEHSLAEASSSGLLLQGKGSDKSQMEFLRNLIVELSPTIDIMSHPLLVLTEKKRALSLCESNRQLISQYLAPTHPAQRLLSLWSTVDHNQKLLSSYTWPLLFKKRKARSKKKGGGDDKSSVLLPHPSGAHIAYPSWFPIPGMVKDGDGSSGGTQQGRITCKDPAAQTFPPPIKACITSRFPSGTRVTIDLSQIELRVAALLSGEQSLLSAYQQNWDVHGRRAVEIWSPASILEMYPVLSGAHIDRYSKICSEFNDIQRQVGKQVNFADLYRAGAEKMQATVYEKVGKLFPLSFFQTIVDSRPFQRPALWRWQNELIATVRKTGILILPFTGQSRYFMGGAKFDENEIVNCPVQATAGNVMLELQAEISSRLEDPLLCTTPIHLTQNTYDALDFDCESGKVGDLKQIISDSVARLCSPLGYWGMLEASTGNRCPLAYDFKEPPCPPPLPDPTPPETTSSSVPG